MTQNTEEKRPFSNRFSGEEGKRLWDSLKKDENGWVVAITLDTENDQPLMQAFMDEAAFLKTLETGEMHYHSRSRKELWHKGATSGHIQIVDRVRVDCDADTLLFYVWQNGAACHTGNRSCFYRKLEDLIE